MSLTPKNWSAFQHYKDRAPSWIKLHRGLLDDYQFSCLPVASRALAPCIWLLASEYDGGKIAACDEEIAYRLHMSVADLRAALKPLINGGFIIEEHDASAPLAERKPDAIPEREKEKEKKESPTPRVRTHDWPEDYQTQFWNAYPKRVDKKAAFKVLERVWKNDDVPWDTILKAASSYQTRVSSTDLKYIKSPEVWLNKGCWDDEDQGRRSERAELATLFGGAQTPSRYPEGII